MVFPSQSPAVHGTPHLGLVGYFGSAGAGRAGKACPHFPTPCPASPFPRALLQITIWLLSAGTGGQNRELGVGFFPLHLVPVLGGVGHGQFRRQSVECDVLPLKMEARNRHSEEMIHLTYFSPWLLRHWGCPAGIPMAGTWGQEFCPYCPQETTRAKQTASGHGPVPTAWFSTLCAHPVGIPQGTRHLQWLLPSTGRRVEVGPVWIPLGFLCPGVL